MYMQHRRDTLRSLFQALREGKKGLSISTQVIEAGIDISFQRVIRFSAGMDRVIQAAGRCNRNAEYGEKQSVFIADCSDEKLGTLKEILQGKTSTIRLLEAFRYEPSRFSGSLSSDEAIAYYYRALYSGMEEGAQDYPVSGMFTLFDLLSNNEKYADELCTGLENYFLWQAFKTAGERFTVFEEPTTDVLVPYGEGENLIKDLCSQSALASFSLRSELLKQAGPYTVSLYEHQKSALEKCGAIVSVCGGCALALQKSFYDGSTGVTGSFGQCAFLEV